MLHRVASSVLAAALLAGCANPRGGTTMNGSTAASAATATPGDWRVLFDGTSTAAWRAYRGDTMPSGWHVTDGTLVRAAEAGDIVTRDVFRDFELTLDWKISPGGNSGIMYRVTEAAEHPYETGPEMQVLDNDKHADGRNPLTSAGALYALYPAPRGVTRPVGEWNSVRIVVKGNHVEHWLNGTKTAEAEIGSADWNAKVAGSKFAEWSGFAKAAEGHIALQDHGDWVAYRNIKIRTIP